MGQSVKRTECSSRPSLTLVQGNAMPTSGLSEHQASTWLSDTQAGKTSIHIKELTLEDKKVKVQSQLCPAYVPEH